MQRDIKNTIKGIILFVIYVAVFIYLIQYVSRNAELIEKIMQASVTEEVVVLFFTIVCMIMTGLMDVTCARAYNISINRVESVGLTFVSAAANLLLPLQLGSVIKAVYLKKKMSLNYARYVSIVSGTAVINMTIVFIQIILSMIITTVKLSANVGYAIIFVIALGVLLISVYFVIKKRDFILRIIPFKKVSVPIMQGFYELLTDKKVVVLVALNLIFCVVMGNIRFFLIFRMLGYDGQMMDSMLYYGLYYASTLIPILPGNIGISEVIVGMMNSVMGSAFHIGVTAVLINRIYYFIVSFGGTIIAAVPLWSRYHREKFVIKDDNE